MLPLTLRTAFIISAVSALVSGCGLYTPVFDYDTQPHVTAFIANKIINHVKCEMRDAIFTEIDKDKKYASENIGEKRRVPWLDTWVATLTLTISVEETGGVSAGVNWNDPLPKGQAFDLGLGAGASADATRMQKVDYLFDIQKDFLDHRYEFRNRPAHCVEPGGILIDSDLRIQDWLDSALFPYFVKGDVGATPPDVLQDDITFVAKVSGDATPSWKLVRFSVNQSGSFLSASRTRTDEVLITIGPGQKPEKKSAPDAAKVPSQAVIDFRNITLIGSAVSLSFKSR